MKDSKPYPRFEEEDNSCLTAQEPAVADYAHIINGMLQVTPDIEEEIAEVERGETVSMGEFKTMFARWLVNR